MRKTSTAIWLTICLISSQLCGADKPNILYILADDLGYSDLGCFGGEIETPNLDLLASDGVRLTQFYNTGRCCPSRASLLTGQYPHRVGLGHMTSNDLGRPGYRGFVSPDAQTIAQMLQPVGYRTFISGKWHLGTPDPTQHGFEEFYGTLVSAKRFFDQKHLIRLPADRTAKQYADDEFYATDAVTDHALDFLKLARETPNRPWFLYLAYHAPHFPLHARPAEISKYKDRYHDGWDNIRAQRLSRMKKLKIVPEHTKLSHRSHWRNYGENGVGVNPAWQSVSPTRRADLARRMAIYAAMVDRLDQQIGRVIADLKLADELENTLIVFTSDNGGCFEWDPYGFDIQSGNQNILHEGEEIERMGKAGTFHSVGSGWANASNTPWRLYKHFNHEGGIASPCIVHWPLGLTRSAGSIDHSPAHIIDLFPTAAASSGAKYVGQLDLPGVNLVEQINNGGAERQLFFEHQGNRAVRDAVWKLVALNQEDWELYDFTVDRTETNNLADKHPEVVQQLSNAWDQWARSNHVTPLPRDLGVPYLKPRRTLTNQPPSMDFGQLIFIDDFDRNESQEEKDEPGNFWTTSSEKTANGNKQVDLRDAHMHIDTHASASHATSLRQAISFRNGTVGLRMMLHGPDDTLKLNFADLECVTVHAGHLFDTTIGLETLTMEDRKTGAMSLEIREARIKGKLTKAQRKILSSKKRSIPINLEAHVWYDLLVHVNGDSLSVDINGNRVGSFSSAGIAHHHKSLVRLLVPQTASVDDVRVWRRK